MPLYREGNSEQKRLMAKMFTSNLSADGKIPNRALLVILAVIVVIELASEGARFFAKARMATMETMNWNTTYQTMDGFGGQTWIYGDNLTGSSADLFFSQTAGIGLSIVRTANTWNGLIPDLTTLQLAVARGAKVELGLQSPPCKLKHSYVDLGESCVDATSTISASLPFPVKAGDTLVVALSFGASSDVVTGCSDSLHNTFAEAGKSVNTSEALGTGVWYAANIAAGTDAITCTFSIPTAYKDIAVHEYAGLAPSTPVDVTVSNDTESTVSSNWTTGSATTHAPGELIFAVFQGNSQGQTLTPGSGFIKRLDNGSIANFTTMAAVQTSAGSISANASSSKADQQSNLMVAFKPAVTSSRTPLTVSMIQTANNTAEAGGTGSSDGSKASPAFDDGAVGSNGNCFASTLPLDGSGGAYQQYANYIVNLINTYQNPPNNVPIAYLDVQNEPTLSAGDVAGGLGSCIWGSGTQFRDFIQNYLGPSLSAAGLHPAVMLASNSQWFSPDYTTECLSNSSCAQYVGIAAGHGYPYPARASAYFLGTTRGKHLWLSETSDASSWDPSITSALKVALNMHQFLTSANVSAYEWWELAYTSSQGNYGLTDQSYSPAKRLYVTGNWSKFVRPGWVRVDANVSPARGISVSAFKDPSTGAFAIVAINQNGSANSMKFSMNGFTTSSITPWITSASDNLAAQGTFSAGSSFSYNLPAKSVTTFVGTNGGGSTPSPDTTSRSVHTNLQVSAISTSKINLSWTASTDNVGVLNRSCRSALMESRKRCNRPTTWSLSEVPSE
jgi:O-glycosyl hydrolase